MLSGLQELGEVVFVEMGLDLGNRLGLNLREPRVYINTLDDCHKGRDSEVLH